MEKKPVIQRCKKHRRITNVYGVWAYENDPFVLIHKKNFLDFDEIIIKDVPCPDCKKNKP